MVVMAMDAASKPPVLPGSGVSGVSSRARAFLSRPYLKYDKAQFLRYTGEVLDVMRKDPWEALAEVPRLEEKLMSTPGWARLTRLLAPDAADLIKSHLSIESTLAVARACLALRIYEAQRGFYPDDLSALAPGILSAAPNDPCTGKPLIYRRTETGFIVYSVGVDQIDNRGNDTPPNESEPEEGVDIVWKTNGESPKSR